MAAVPAPRETVEGEVESELELRFACPACGRKYATKASLAGKKIRCSRCGAGVRVPVGDAIAVGEASRSATPAPALSDASMAPPLLDRNPQPVGYTLADGGDAPDRASSLLEELAPSESAPRRRAAVVLSSRAEMMEQVRQQAAVETSKDADQAKRAKKKKKRRKKSGYFDPKETLTLIAGVGVVVGVIALLAWRFPDFRFPLGGLLAVIGFIVYLLGAASLRQLVAEEGFVKLIFYRFFPPYQWWFVATRWSDTKDYFAFFASGLMIMSIGGAVLKTSPTGKKADESERAYQKLLNGPQAESPPPVMKAEDDSKE